MVSLKLNDKVEIKAKTKYDTAKFATLYQEYQTELVNASVNTTLTNPYSSLNLTFLAEGSSISCLYVPMFEESKGWYAYIRMDASIQHSDDLHPIQLWDVPTDMFASGSGAKTIDRKGIYIIMATVDVENVEEIQLLFMKQEEIYCNSILKCKETCKDEMIFSCIVEISEGDTTVYYTHLTLPTICSV